VELATSPMEVVINDVGEELSAMDLDGGGGGGGGGGQWGKKANDAPESSSGEYKESGRREGGGGGGGRGGKPGGGDAEKNDTRDWHSKTALPPSRGLLSASTRPAFDSPPPPPPRAYTRLLP